MADLNTRRILLIAAAFLATCTAALADSDANRIAIQFRQYCLQESTDHGQRLLDDVEMPTTKVAEALRLARSLNADGSWSDIDYAGHARSAWEPGDHLTRILSIIVCARRSDTDPADRAVCITAVHRALAFWMPRDFKCPNWWYNDIGGPKILGNVALLLGDDLKPDELKYIAGTVLARSKVGAMTGQNRVWLAGNGVMRALLTHDDALLAKAVGVIEDEINVSRGDEGIQPDWSFHQHGPQQQFGNYGMAYAVEMSRWASVLRDTRFAISPEKIGVIRNYFLQGQAWVTWHDMMDVSACGRQLFPNSQKKKAGVIRAAMRSMATADPIGAKDYLAFVARTAANAPNDLIGNRVFWRSDYVIHRRPEFAATLKMSSSRVIGGETVNSEDLSGARLADGAMYLYRTGHEYENIFPVWDWRKLPGTTSADDHASLTWTGKKDRAKAPDFVGGVTDGTNGCAAMDFHRETLTAKKSWFFAGDTLVCLGSGITSTEAAPVYTTINQCLLSGPVTVQSHGQPATLRSANANLADADWVEHDGLRYVFPKPQAVTISAGPRTGNWHRVFNNPSSPKDDVTQDVFTLCIDHGSSPEAGSYEYCIVPADHADQPPVRIVANTEKVQAVQTSGHWCGAVFWTAGGVDLDGVSVAVDRPCVLMMDSVNGSPHVTLTDPTQKLEKITVTIRGNTEIVKLPRGGDAGKSIAVE